MKKKLIVLALIVTLLCSGCGSKIPTLSNGDEAVITLKDGNMISAQELYDSLKSDYALQAMMNLVDKKILEDKYSDKLDEANDATEENIKVLEEYYGDKLEETIRQNTSFQTIDAYKNAYYINYLSQLAIDDYTKAQITDKQVKKYYDDEIVGDIKVSHILFSANVTDEMTDEEKENAEKEAKEKAESVLSELRKADKSELNNKFAELAKDHSEDESTKDNGGSLGFINKDTLSESYAELVDAAYKLKDGEVASKIVTTEIGYHIIYRSESKEKAELDDSLTDTIKTELAADYLKDHLDAQIKALQELRKEYEMEIVDTELQEQYAKYIQSALNLYQQQQQQQQNQANQSN